MTTTNTAKAIRKQLKTELGATSRDISVRTDNYSMGCTFRVTIKSARFSLADVKRIASIGRNVRHCEATGEILSGGNTFVNVDYAADAIMPIADAVRPSLDKLDELDAGTIETVFGVDVSRDDNGGFRVWGAAVSCWDARTAARVIAETMLEGGEHCDAELALTALLNAALELELDLTDAVARVMAIAAKAAA